VSGIDPSGGEQGRSVRRRRARTPAAREARRSERVAIEDPAVVLAAAARFLEARPRSVAETRRHLVGVGYRPDLVEGSVARLSELGLLDDESFARAWVASRDRAHPRGERALRSELARKGIDRELVELVLAGRLGEDTPTEADADEIAAGRLLERRRAALERVVDPRTRRQRAYALLARNGFGPDVATRVAERFVRPDPHD